MTCSTRQRTPSRAAILTGKYSHKNGVPVFNTFDGSQWTVAQELQRAGYHTGMMGKWHLGGPEHDPEKNGFDLNIAGTHLPQPPSEAEQERNHAALPG